MVPHSGYARLGPAGVVEFLPPIPAGREPRAFLAELERVVEAASDKLMAEAAE